MRRVASLGGGNEHAGRLDDKKRIAAGALGDLDRLRIRDVTAAGMADEVDRLLGRERIQPEEHGIPAGGSPVGSYREKLGSGQGEDQRAAGSVPSRPRRRAPTGEKVAVSVKERAGPRRPPPAAPPPAVSSSASRDLPIPASPTMVTSTGRPVEVASPRLWSRIACSLARPTNGIVRRADRVVRPSTGNASRAESKPLALTRRRRPNATLMVVRA